MLGIPSAHNLPEVLDHFVLFLVTAVIGVLLPVVDIDVGDTTNEQLEFSLVKDVDEVGRDQFIEPDHKSVELLLNSLHNLPLRHQLNVLRLVLIGDGDVPTTRDQINSGSLAELLIIDGKGEFDDPFNVIIPVSKRSAFEQPSRQFSQTNGDLQSPSQISVQVLIDTFHILQGDLLSQHHLVECTNEERVQEATVEDGKTDHTSNELEVVEVLGVDAGMRVDLQGVVVVCRVFE